MRRLVAQPFVPSLVTGRKCRSFNLYLVIGGRTSAAVTKGATRSPSHTICRPTSFPGCRTQAPASPTHIASPPHTNPFPHHTTTPAHQARRLVEGSRQQHRCLCWVPRHCLHLVCMVLERVLTRLCRHVPHFNRLVSLRMNGRATWHGESGMDTCLKLMFSPDTVHTFLLLHTAIPPTHHLFWRRTCSFAHRNPSPCATPTVYTPNIHPSQRATPAARHARSTPSPHSATPLAQPASTYRR